MYTATPEIYPYLHTLSLPDALPICRHTLLIQQRRNMRRVGAYVGDDWFGAARQAVANRAGHQLGRGKRRRANDNHGSIVAFAFQYGPDCAAQQIWLQTRKRHINGIAIQSSVENGRASGRERGVKYV